MNDYNKGLILTTIGVLILTPDAMLIRLISTDAVVLASLRNFMLGVMFILFSIIIFKINPIAEIKRAGWIGRVMGFSFGFSSFCFILALNYTSAANLLIILALSPLWSAVFSRLIMKETLARPTLLAMLFSLLGVMIVFYDGIFQPFESPMPPLFPGLGELLALCASLLLALNLTMIRAKKHINVLPLNGAGAIFFALLLVPFMGEIDLNATQWGLTFLLGLIVVPVSFLFILIGPRYITSAEVGLLMLIETVLGPYWVWLAVGEEPAKASFLGGAIILITLITHALWRVNQKKAI